MQNNSGCSFCGASFFDSLHGFKGCKFCTGAGMAPEVSSGITIDEKIKLVNEQIEKEKREKK